MAFPTWQPRPWQLRAAAIVGLLFLAVFGWFVIDLIGSIPSKKELRAFSDMASANILFDAADREVFTIAKEHRIEVPLAEISPNLIKAVIAIEDRRFFDHEGFDPIRIIGSAIAVARAGEAVQGGSTITQQLARQSVGREKTLSRKLRELLFAARLEHHFTKDEILELYLNKVYFGNGLYGAEAAARGYFGKKASAVVARRSVAARRSVEGAVKLRPVSPRRRKRRRGRPSCSRRCSRARRSRKEEYDTAFKTQIEIYDGLRSEEPYGQYFKDEVRRQLVEQFGSERVEQGGLKVYTTIDPYMQRAADAAVDREHCGDREVAAQDARRRAIRCRRRSSRSIPDTGAVRAMVGGRDFSASNFNRATRATPPARLGLQAVRLRGRGGRWSWSRRSHRGPRRTA